MRRLRVFASCVASFTLAVTAVLAAAGAGTFQNPQGTVTGRVTDAANARPVAGALVVFSPGGLAAITDANGNYQATMNVGTYSLTVSVSGRANQSVFGLVVKSGDTATVNFAMRLPPSTGLLTGRIRQSGTGDAIAGATVGVTSNGASATTDEAGIYTLMLPAASYTLTVSASGYLNTTSTGATVSNQASTTRDVSMTPVAASVMGHVRDGATETPIANASVTITPGSTSLTTDANGRYSASVPSGTYTISVSAAGYQSASSENVFLPNQVTIVRDYWLVSNVPLAVFESLRSFRAGPNGFGPTGALVAANDGNFYGTTASGGTSNAGLVFKVTPAGDLTVLYTFTGGTDGAGPSPLIQAADGAFYGTTNRGGDANWYGTIFKITATGTFTRLYSFSDGQPAAPLVQGSDGNLYGTTSYGGTWGSGIAFRMTPSGTFTTLHAFNYNVDGYSPSAALIQGTDGNFYGTVRAGRATHGAVFRLTPSGAVTILHAFAGGTEGGSPMAPLVQAADGAFFGTTSSEGPFGFGTVFRVTPTGSFSLVNGFSSGADGAYPTGLIAAADGNIYGTTQLGGSANRGVAYRVTQAGAFSVVRSFTSDLDVLSPTGNLVQGPDGAFYGTSGGVSSAWLVYKMTLAGDVSVLKESPAGEGFQPSSALVQGPDGNLYGTTGDGGAGWGTAFKMSPAGTITTLHSFSRAVDGAWPMSLMLAADGNFYGTTSYGGSGDQGTVFKMTPDGVTTTLHVFTGAPDGASPYAGLTQGSDGNLYGTTLYGGNADSGVAFKMTPDGVLTVLHMFGLSPGGYYPGGQPLVQAADGNFYGTTYWGGTFDSGTIFRMTPSGTVATLHSFDYGVMEPNGLIWATDGSFYGTTYGAYYDGYPGSVFKMTAGGQVTTLRTFSNSASNPSVGLVQGTDGNFYGTTPFANSFSLGGAVFRISPSGAFTLLYRFNTPDSVNPSSLVQGTDGSFYGTTSYGGDFGLGTAFRLTVLPASAAPDAPPQEQSSGARSAVAAETSSAPATTPIATIVSNNNGSIAIPKITARFVPSPASEKPPANPVVVDLQVPPVTIVATPRDVAALLAAGNPLAIVPAKPETTSGSGNPVASSVASTPAPPVAMPSIDPPAQLIVPPPPPPPQRRLRTKNWEVEIFGSALFGNDAGRGTAARLPGGSAFTTMTGMPSVRVSSWYFGDGAGLLNNVNAALSASAKMTPLDQVLSTAVAKLDSTGGGGVRLRRTISPRVSTEFTAEVNRVRVGITADALSAIEASRASFIAVWTQLAAAGQFENAAVTSVRTVKQDVGRQFVATAAANVSLKQIGKLNPYVTAGGGFAVNTGSALNAKLVGDYQFSVGGVTPVHESDTVNVRFTADGHSLIALFGGGVKYAISPRFGIRVDGRAYVSPNHLSTRLDTNPAVQTMTPAGSGSSLTNPGIQFSNNPSIGVQSNLSGLRLKDEHTFTGTGVQRQFRITVGAVWRF